MSDVPASPSRWLYGPVPDLLLGCGLLYGVVCLVFALEGGALFARVPLVVPALLIALVSAPHYGATLVRVYDRREDRRGYFLFSVVSTLVLLAIFGIALFTPYVGSLLATVYLTWAGWHYTGQNYGIATLFLRRRGVELEGAARRLLYLSFVLSFGIVFLVMHGQAAPLADPAREVRLVPLAIPEFVNRAAIPLIIVSYLATSFGWIGLLIRRGVGLGDLGPSVLISLTQALWWSIPYAARHYSFATDIVPVGWDARSLFFPWIACAHALQYLWITSFYARRSAGRSGGWSEQARYYALVLTAGSAVWALPALVFAPGAHAFDWNFALLLAATVNIHHFILDGAIWKLRNLKIAGILIRDAGEALPASARGRWVRKGVWALAIGGLVLTLHSLVEQYVIEPSARAAGDLEAVADSLDRQAWLGKTSAYSRFRLGRQFERAGDLAAAVEQFELSAAMEPRVESIKRLIGHAQRANDSAGFVSACDRLFSLPNVERPLPTPDVTTMGPRVPKAFWDACVASARAARPTERDASDATGGAGQDGGVPRQARYPQAR